MSQNLKIAGYDFQISRNHTPLRPHTIRYPAMITPGNREFGSVDALSGNARQVTVTEVRNSDGRECINVIGRIQIGPISRENRNMGHKRIRPARQQQMIHAEGYGLFPGTAWDIKGL